MPNKRVTGPVLSPAARKDIRDALRWSEQKFGTAAAVRYRALIKQAVRDIGSDPERPGSKELPEIMIRGARIYHISLSRTRVTGSRVKEPRHFLIYRHRGKVIEVARVLHDIRDLQRHLPPAIVAANQAESSAERPLLHPPNHAHSDILIK